jgi:8-oxo-dGTP pyrophosphatase MutT (NUDIX family)
VPALDGPVGPDEGSPPGQGWRRSAKALLVDPAGRLLLLHLHDPVEAALGRWWELPGGGVEDGESDEQACAREVAEETGYVVDPAAVGPVLWRRRATFRWLGVRRWQLETVHVVRLPPGARPTASTPTDEESSAFLGSRWFAPAALADLAAAGERLYPGRLDEVAPRLLRGEVVPEGFERWS